jgi:hypothetical protein
LANIYQRVQFCTQFVPWNAVIPGNFVHCRVVGLRDIRWPFRLCVCITTARDGKGKISEMITAPELGPRGGRERCRAAPPRILMDENSNCRRNYSGRTSKPRNLRTLVVRPLMTGRSLSPAQPRISWAFAWPNSLSLYFGLKMTLASRLMVSSFPNSR